MPPVKKEISLGSELQLAQNLNNLALAPDPPPFDPDKCGFIKENKEQCQRKKQTVDGKLTRYCWSHNAVDVLEDDPVEQIKQLKKEIEEHEAVEAYMMNVVKGGGGYDDLLRAHYRDGEVVDGKWVERE